MPDTFHILFQTPFGKMGLVWMESEKDLNLCRVILSSEKRRAERILEQNFPYSRPGSRLEIEALAVRIGEFLRGEDVTFEMNQLFLDRCSPFQQQVLRIEHGVPRGRVTSYRRIAEKVSRPRSARAVGRALASNPFPILIPCHRAIRSDGTLGGFQGGPAMKRALLTLEGIEFGSNGKVLSPSFF
jgi:methylated-DNA-[protein]-cysteine S-methyltransferase